MTSECPANFILEEDCCITPDVNIGTLNSYSITNIDSIQTNKLHTTQLYANKTTYIDEGHILTKQTVAPTTSIGVPQGITSVTLSANATDIAGTVTIMGSPLNTGEANIIFHTPYPSGTQPVVSLIGANLPGALAFVSGVYSVGVNTHIRIVFNANVTSANPVFHYQVICPVS